MGTAIRAEIWHEDRSVAQAAAEAVMGEMHRIDRAMSPYKSESELSLINREAAERPVPVSEEMFALLLRSIEFSQRSEGAFDITFASVGHLYDYREKIRPTDNQIKDALPGFNYRFLHLDAKRRSVRFAKTGMQIDLGGIAKGHAVDNCIQMLKMRGVREAMVSAGGDSRVLGTKRGRPWMIGIRDPRRPDKAVAMMPLVDAAISTSGDYERYFEEDGIRHHHILDPTTGKSPAGMRSVTVIGPDATTTEGFSKIVFIKGVQEGLRIIDAEKELCAVVVDRNGNLYYSKGLMAPAPVNKS